MIRKCTPEEFGDILEIINDAAEAYRGIIPADRWHEPYMPAETLRKELAAGVEFYAFEAEGRVRGVMGIQHVGDVTLIRHAYVRTEWRGRGIGGKLLDHLKGLTDRPVLVGTWAAAAWAIRFYVKHGFTQVSEEEKSRLLRTYWSIPERQVETSVVLADAAWRGRESVARTTMESLRVVREQDQMAKLLGIEVLEAGNGRARVRMKIRPDHLNGVNTVHGGAIFTLADYAFALACNSHGFTSVAVNGSISYLKAAREGTLAAEAQEADGSGKMNVCVVRITDDSGDLVACFQGLSYRKGESRA